jgi:hypothetical protein
MPHEALTRTIALDRQSDIPTRIADWDSLSANGGLIAWTGLDRSNLRQATIDNENLNQRPAKTRDKLLALKNNAFSGGSYLYSTDSNAAAGSQATRDVLDELLLNALGGEVQGYAADIEGGTASAPEVTAAHGDNLGPWEWGFFFDDSEGVGHFRQWESVTDGGGGDDTLAMAPGHDLPFTPASGDVLHAVEVHYPDFRALNDHTAANHTLLSFYLKGSGPQDNFEVIGCKVQIEFESIAAGKLVKMTVNVKAVDFFHEGLSQPDLAGPVAGRPGDVAGSGARTRFEIADFGSNLAEHRIVGEIKPTIGIEPEYIASPAGYEGVNGFGITEASHHAQMLEFSTLDYGGSADNIDDWNEEFRARQHKHVLIQVGTNPTDAVGLYFPYLSHAAEPQAFSAGGREGRTLSMVVRERPNDDEDGTDGVDVSGLSTAEINLALAKFYILRTK